MLNTPSQNRRFSGWVCLLKYMLHRPLLLSFLLHLSLISMALLLAKLSGSIRHNTPGPIQVRYRLEKEIIKTVAAPSNPTSASKNRSSPPASLKPPASLNSSSSSDSSVDKSHRKKDSAQRKEKAFEENVGKGHLPSSPTLSTSKKQQLSSQVASALKALEGALDTSSNSSEKRSDALESASSGGGEGDILPQTEQEWVIAALQAWLVLPEYGVVVALLEIAQSGLINKVEIISSQSEANASYILETLDHAKLPIKLSGSKVKRFKVALNNE